LQFAKEQGEIETNPARDAVISKYETKPHQPWTADDIKKFREFWEVGTPERQAMEVVYWTGARCVDARNLGWQKVEGGVLEFVQQKTGGTAFVPITDEAPESLREDQKIFLECIGSDIIWITTRNGRPRSQKGLSQLISAAASKAGLPDGRSAHGLRKARAISLVYAGWTPHKIGAWTGHDSLKEVEDYTKGVNKRALVSSGNGKLVQIGFQKGRKT
jgi:integrase